MVLKIIDDKFEEDGTVLVQSFAKGRKVNPANQFFLDYEDYILFKKEHWYLFSSTIGRIKKKKAEYLTRHIVRERGFLPDTEEEKITVFRDWDIKSKNPKNFSKRYLTVSDGAGMWKLPRGIIKTPYGYQVRIPLHPQDALVRVGTTQEDYDEAVHMYRNTMKAMYGREVGVNLF